MKKLIFATKSKLALNVLKVLFPEETIVGCSDLKEFTLELALKKRPTVIVDDTFWDSTKSDEESNVILSLADRAKTWVLLSSDHPWQKSLPSALAQVQILTKPVLDSDLAKILEAL